MKRIHITLAGGRIYSVDANAVAHDIATTRSEENPDVRYGLEFEAAIKDNLVLVDWLENNMNWWNMTPMHEHTPPVVDLRDAEVINMEVHEEKRK